MALTQEQIKNFEKDYEANRVATEDRTEELMRVLSTPLIRRVERRLNEMFTAPEEERQGILDRIFAEERAKESSQATDL